MHTARDSFELVRHLGWRWVAQRAWYAARRRLGGLERAMPARPWNAVEAPDLFLASPPVGPPRLAGGAAEAIRRGEFVLFSHHKVAAGFPPAWNRNQLSGESLPADEHWSRIGDFRFGDIKGVWELSRCGWAYALVREGSELAAQTFWLLWADWLRCNPPNSGPNWMCGQEASIRLMAVVFAAERFGVPPEQTPDFARFVVATARRIEANLAYALNQQNNHGLSECVGLLTAALIVPGHDRAVRWRRSALQHLQAQVEELVYEDGSFSQHSLVYHRVALHQLCWATLRMRAAGEREPDWLAAAGRRATDFLAAITDPTDGEAPLYGANDGADLLPLSDCGFLDMRPAVQLGAAVFHGVLRYAPGPWDEPVRWLVARGENLPRSGDIRTSCDAPAGGLLHLRSDQDRLVLRCPGRFRHRPSQADFGHVDVWLGGQRVAIDGGSYSYNSQERFTQLGSAREHNAVTFGGLEPMRKATRFLYLPWPTGELRQTATGEWSYEPHLYSAAGIRWCRHVARRVGGGFIVRDEIGGATGRQIRWHWRLADAEWEESSDAVRAELGGRRVELRWRGGTGITAALRRAEPESAAGWHSRHYAAAEPAVSLVLHGAGTERVEATFEFFSK